MEKFTHIMLNLHNNTKCYYECWKTAFNNSRTNQTWNSNNLLFQQPKHQSRTWSTFSTERNGSCFLIEVSESHPSSSRTKSLGQWTSWCDSIKFATAEKNWSMSSWLWPLIKKSIWIFLTRCVATKYPDHLVRLLFLVSLQQLSDWMCTSVDLRSNPPAESLLSMWDSNSVHQELSLGR